MLFQTNKYCSLSNLRNESDVEQFFLGRLLEDLGYTADYLETKAGIAGATVGKGRKRKEYFPDYIAHVARSKNKPVLVVDAKHPNKPVTDGVDEAQLYASVIRRRLATPKPDQFCVGCNGHQFLVKHHDSAEIIHSLQFSDFIDGNPKFEALKGQLSRNQIVAASNAARANHLFAFRKVAPSDLPSIFETCHRKIWKTEKKGPASAFYEFSKLTFVKIDEDKRVRERLAAYPNDTALPDGFVPQSVVHFAAHWITEMEEDSDNPINTILFGQLARRLEEQIQRGEKKRIFDQGEGIKLAPSTIKEVVKLLEHLDLGAVDEDLNGRMFETFLTATMRGEALGQFFTPRNVVKFMVQMANPRVTRHKMDSVLDGCCGTGGFLIEAMAYMGDQIIANSSLSIDEQNRLLYRLKTDALWGIDAGSDPSIARIARLNMHLHRDGGSRIYQADALDKHLRTEQGVPLQHKLEIDELRASLLEGPRKQFTVLLTNPPFSMTYERKDPAELAILQDYSLSINENGQPRRLLKSSVMFLERYWELLAGEGRLATVMDESVLNTVTNSPFRRFILDHFIIKAVIRLPKNAFVKAQTSVLTSVLYLRKKTDANEQQPAIYMALCDNVGHSDSGKERPRLNQLPEILAEFRSFEEHGDLERFSSPKGFLLFPKDIFNGNPTLRLDASYFNPRYFNTLHRLDEIAHMRGWSLVPLHSLLQPGKDSMTGGATPLGASYPDEGPKFVRVQNVRPNRLVWHADEDACITTEMHNGLLARSQLREREVVYTITGTYGVAAVVPEAFGEANINQHSVRLRVKPDEVKPEYLAAFLNSNLCRPQVDRAATGSSRLALDYDAVRQVRVLVPSTIEEQEQIIDSIRSHLTTMTALNERAAVAEAAMSEVLAT